MTEIYHYPYIGNDLRSASHIEKASEIISLEPDPLFKDVVKHRTNETEFVRCPCVRDYCKDTFIVRSPLDINFQVTGEGEKRSIKTFQYNQDWFDRVITPRFDESINTNLMSLDVASMLLWSKSDFDIEITPCVFHGHVDFVRNTQIIPGTFSPSKWTRPIQATFEVLTDDVIKVKRGDPLYYVKFKTKSRSKIKFTKATPPDSLVDAVEGCIRVKYYIPGLSMKQNYELFAPYLKAYKKSFFKKVFKK